MWDVVRTTHKRPRLGTERLQLHHMSKLHQEAGATSLVPTKRPTYEVDIEDGRLHTAMIRCRRRPRCWEMALARRLAAAATARMREDRLSRADALQAVIEEHWAKLAAVLDRIGCDETDS